MLWSFYKNLYSSEVRVMYESAQSTRGICATSDMLCDAATRRSAYSIRIRYETSAPLGWLDSQIAKIRFYGVSQADVDRPLGGLFPLFLISSIYLVGATSRYARHQRAIGSEALRASRLLLSRSKCAIQANSLIWFLCSTE
ncbi:hypothetical protein PLICRDRAFT_291831 [Plicaturopsis crispa FD-325 SS-3]|nr:hypothetical protein PLICRDRAFT_291831 [Plicaturopsis crispa FD-325 SS-3]